MRIEVARMVRYPVDVVVERVPLANRWLDPQWRTAAVFPVSRHDESTVDHWVATCERAGENAPPALPRRRRRVKSAPPRAQRRIETKATMDRQTADGAGCRTKSAFNAGSRRFAVPR
jgi:hypothetical protein